jgi:hypothetical protein
VLIDGANRARGERPRIGSHRSRLDQCNVRAFRRNCLLEIAVFGARLRHLTLVLALGERSVMAGRWRQRGATRNPIFPEAAGIAQTRSRQPRR